MPGWSDLGRKGRRLHRHGAAVKAGKAARRGRHAMRWWTRPALGRPRPPGEEHQPLGRTAHGQGVQF